jgi:putative hydrolase of the HAD superfamily
VIVPEKNESAYSVLLREHELHCDHAFMIGNSPRSDVLPALAAGLWAVFLPHPQTWEYEDHPIHDHPRLLRAETFDRLPHVLSRHSYSSTAQA